jgi:hypothetical protein
MEFSREVMPLRLHQHHTSMLHNVRKAGKLFLSRTWILRGNSTDSKNVCYIQNKSVLKGGHLVTV